MYSPLSKFLEKWNWIYLKSFFIQDPGAKDGYAIGVETGTVTPAQGLGQLLFTVNSYSHSLLLNADAYTMPPEMDQRAEDRQQKRKVKDDCTWDAFYLKPESDCLHFW